MPKTPFKLTFRQMEIFGGPKGRQRALIIAVAPMPQPGWMRAVLACEDGNMQTKAIHRMEFEQAEKTQVTLHEVEDVAAPSIIYETKTPAA